MRIRAVWSGLERETCEGGFGSRRVTIEMVPMMGKTPLILRSVVPAIPKELGERAYLEEDLTSIGCIGLLNKPWTVKGVSTLRLVNFGKIHVYCSKHRVQNSTFRTSAELILAVDFGLLLSY